MYTNEETRSENRKSKEVRKGHTHITTYPTCEWGNILKAKNATIFIQMKNEFILSFFFFFLLLQRMDVNKSTQRNVIFLSFLCSFSGLYEIVHTFSDTAQN